jgi:hypothetical protein
MSYDLYFDVNSGKGINKKKFAAYFTSRRHYQVENGQALYENEDTGAVFIFDEPQDGMVACNLNYYRPHVYALEAVVELQAFDEAFGLTAIDPQDDETGEEGRFERERFLRAWNEGNRLAYRALLKEESDPVHTWPAQRIREVWEWNYGRPSEEECVEGSLFVPGIFAAAMDGAAASLAIWVPDCAILLPAVDALLVPAAPGDPANEDLALVRWEEVLPVLAPYKVEAAGLARYHLAFDHWPEQIAAFLGATRQPTGQLEGVALDQILDRELVEQASR